MRGPRGSITEQDALRPGPSEHLTYRIAAVMAYDGLVAVGWFRDALQRAQSADEVGIRQFSSLPMTLQSLRL